MLVAVTASGVLAYEKLDGNHSVSGETLSVRAVVSYNKVVVLLVKQDNVVAIVGHLILRSSFSTIDLFSSTFVKFENSELIFSRF